MIVFQKSHCMNLQNEFVGEKIDIQVSVRISMRRSVFASMVLTVNSLLFLL